MTKQIQLIGEHPDNTHPFGKWLAVNDLPDSDTKCHRELTESIEVDDELNEWMARKVIDHHYTQFRIDRLKEKYGSLGFPQYAEQHRKLPIADKVKKGNATEILLTDYLQTTQRKEFIKVFKLKYNPNVDQSMKGDDVLLVDQDRIIVGESKFRSTPSKKSIEDASNSMNDELLFFFLLLVVLFNNECWFDRNDDSLLFFFLLLVIIFCNCGVF